MEDGVMGRSGFTAIELLIVVILIGVILAIGFPKMHQAVDSANVRATRVDVTTFTALARADAVQRGCRGVIHFVSGATSRVWVTACPRYNVGVGTVDTVASIDNVQNRYGVSLTSTSDSVQFDPRGLRTDNNTTIVRFTGNVSSTTDSVTINPVGKVVR
jgi:prepilin-type N-terminal cleavage/methylation domain-containing protein